MHWDRSMLLNQKWRSRTREKEGRDVKDLLLPLLPLFLSNHFGAYCHQLLQQTHLVLPPSSLYCSVVAES